MVVAVSGVGRAQQSQKVPPPGTATKGSNPAERASGVILKVEAVKKGVTPGSTIEREAKAGRERPVTHRLTVNTNAVWRDWARDQAKVQDNGPPGRDAKQGANSVATKGEPADANNVVVVDIGPETKVETRFRSPLDETSKGSTVPETARSDNASGSGARRDSARPVQFRAEDLKPGLFVEVDFRHSTAQNVASTVTVIRPIQSGDTGSGSPKSGGR
jgi:hypothetical protein